MKKLLTFVAALSFGTAFAQSGGGMSDLVNIEGQGAKAAQDQRHMIEFNARSVPTLIYSFTKDKTKGTSSENDSDFVFDMNYAYSIHPNVQLGGRFNYFNGIGTAGFDTERLTAEAVGWFNFKGGDLQNSPFVSLSLGAGYQQGFGAGGGRDDLLLSTVSIGKRFGMERWGVKPLTWAPEIALTNTNSTANSTFDFQQAVEFRLLQFSVIW